MEETDNRVQIYTAGKAAVVTCLFTITVATGTATQTMRAETCFSG